MKKLPGLLISLGLALVLIVPNSLITNAQVLEARRGVLNASSWKLTRDRLPLNGGWKWFDNRLVEPANAKSEPADYVDFPSLWNDTREAGNDRGLGVATYTLVVIIPEGKHDLALEIPQIYSSYKLWVNGELISQNGQVAANADSYTPQWKPEVVNFQSGSDSLHFVLQIANFSHFKGGCKEPLFLGDASLMLSKSKLDRSSNLAEFVTLMSLGLAFLVVFAARADKASLFFALLCISWAVRSVLSNRYLFITEFPDFDWTLMVKIEYLMLFSTMIWGMLFLDQLFPTEVNSLAKYMVLLVNAGFVATTLATDPFVFTRWLTVYLSVSGFVLVYGSVIVIRSWINEHAGSGWVTASIFWAIGIFTYDIFAYEGLFAYNSIIFGAGYTIVYILLGVALLYHLHVFKTTLRASKLTFDEIYKNSPRH